MALNEPNPTPESNPTPAPEPTPNPAPNAASPSPEPTPEPTPSPWGDKWREAIAGDDKKRMKDLERVRDPKALYDRYSALRARMDAGELKEPFPNEGTDKEKAAWRVANGVPETPDSYLKDLDGVVIGETDKENALEFTKAMHDLNAPPAVVKTALGFHYKMVEQSQAKRLEQDDQDKTSAQESLIADMGLADYRRNVNGIVSWADSLPDGAGEKILNARGPDGMALLNDPTVAKALMQMVREINPTHMVVPGTGADAVKSIADEMASIKKTMGDKKSAYWTDGGKTQARYKELVEANERLNNQAA